MTDRKRQILNYNGPVPPMPITQDFITNIERYHRAIGAILDGAPKDTFEWRPDEGVLIGTPCRYHSNDLLQRNLRALEHWETLQKTKQQAARKAEGRAQNQASKGSERERALGILRWAQDRLSRVGEGVRDDATRDAIYHLGAFVNDGYLNETDVEDAIVRASYNNALAYDHENGGIAKIMKDIPRGLAKAAADGIHVDWDDMDRRANG
jgi:hypothetical protein